MKFIELTGQTLKRLLADDQPNFDLGAAGVHDQTILRVNEQGDIEVRRRDKWDVIGGLLGDFDHRLRQESGLDWA
ncbi:MAG: hypothetical protein SFU86_00725 [Pirellulaceae bacterium]|nr:hypothetical protein [Pirellulaceae bacterium]